MAETADRPVPHEIIPCRHLPPARYRDLAPPPSWKKLVGPSVLLLGLSIGSGEFVLWPYITYKFGFGVFWACMLGVLTQYFINMEIERWTLATGETATTGFCRLWKHWSWVFLLCNIIPWAWPGWASGAATLVTWEFGGGETTRVALSIGLLIGVGLALTLGPVVYRTVELLQVVMVALILVFLLVIFALTVEVEHLGEMFAGILNVGFIPEGMSLPLFLGALAFAGAGGTMNLAQSAYVREQGYGMGRYAGRLTSPLTGKEEVVSDLGFHFEPTEQNLKYWRAWWKAANREHFITFYLLSVLTLMLLSLISYSTTRNLGTLGGDLEFVRAEGEYIGQHYGGIFRHLFNWMGFAILMTTELGLIDACSRISTDIIKVNWLRDSTRWTDSRIYFCLLWAQIAFGCLVMLSDFNQPLLLLVLSASLNGGVMLIYSVLLLWLNNRVLRGPLAMHPVRFVAMVWACGFFGYFTFVTIRDQLPRLWQ
ncbi:MAG: Nramp family divalent metal transporter [Candidatus Handelsmanbacteria bacterium]|nr:Nramp family divalent metal transporter [Candidatus Handelsmanbacteria bacterium]